MAIKQATTALAVLTALFHRAAVEEWQTPTEALAVAGEASYYAPGVMAQVAEYRRLDLSGYLGGVAMMRAGDLGREVWVQVDDVWQGPFLVVDCAQREHYLDLVRRGRVIEFDRAAWESFGWPDRPVPVVVSFSGPWPGPAAWQ